VCGVDVCAGGDIRSGWSRRRSGPA